MRAVDPRPPALLVGADFFYGTLAATRAFGRAGIPVVVADRNVSAPACWSRYVRRRKVCPSSLEPEQLIDWLLGIGRDEGAHVLCPTNDDTAWLFSRYRDVLGTRHYMYQPGVDAVYQVVNKWKLFELCERVGMPTPRTWFPRSDDELERVCDEARFPVLIKPMTQVLFPPRSKGLKVSNPAGLKDAYSRESTEEHCELLRRFDPTVGGLLVQEFIAEAAESIYGLSGFVDDSGNVAGLRASVKVLQRPKRLGVGLCFEKAAVREDLAEKIERLSKLCGYRGIFEVEFISTEEGPALIDFNPRFYNQMAFDIDRGATLPLMSYHAALGQWSQVQRLCEQAAVFNDEAPGIFTHSFALEVLLRSQRLSGVLHETEEKQWREWYAQHGTERTDAVHDPEDWVPGAIDTFRLAFHYVLHPRAFLRSVAFSR